jgi:hypothetical protein
MDEGPARTLEDQGTRPRETAVRAPFVVAVVTRERAVDEADEGVVATGERVTDPDGVRVPMDESGSGTAAPMLAERRVVASRPLTPPTLADRREEEEAAGGGRLVRLGEDMALAVTRGADTGPAERRAPKLALRGPGPAPRLRLVTAVLRERLLAERDTRPTNAARAVEEAVGAVAADGTRTKLLEEARRDNADLMEPEALPLSCAPLNSCAWVQPRASEPDRT